MSLIQNSARFCLPGARNLMRAKKQYPESFPFDFGALNKVPVSSRLNEKNKKKYLLKDIAVPFSYRRAFSVYTPSSISLSLYSSRLILKA